MAFVNRATVKQCSYNNLPGMSTQDHPATATSTRCSHMVLARAPEAQGPPPCAGLAEAQEAASLTQERSGEGSLSCTSHSAWLLLALSHSDNSNFIHCILKHTLKILRLG